MIDNLPDGIYAKDTDGRKTLANPADLNVLGAKPRPRPLAKPTLIFFRPEIAAKFMADDKAVIAGEPVINREDFSSTKSAGNTGC